ncbi:MAG TPA: VCBS repeat-containing protein [Actinomycetota bacterium]|nr:VCBS repeat-containing protein [Actinomycetota bacterium]
MQGRTFRQRVLFPAGILVLAACVVTASFALERGSGEDEAAAGPTPRYHFRDVTEAAGVKDAGRTWGSAWADFESDGDPDLFLVRHWREPILFLNEGGVFDAIPTPPDLVGTHMDRHACAWGEGNQDGRPDILCTQGADNGQGEGPNQLLLNTGDSLRDRAPQFRIQYAKARGRTVNWVDYDEDGDLDVFLGTTERPRFPMELFKRGRENFRKARVGLSHELSVLTSTWADWDRDRDYDLLVTQHYPYVTVAYENRGKSFRPVHLPRITGKKWLSASWGDFNGDGWMDLQLAGRKRLRIYRNRKGRLRPVYKTRLKQGRAGTWFDVDNDGDLDSFVVQGARGNRPKDDSVNWRDFLVVRKKGGFKRVEEASFRGPTTGNGEQATIADYDRDGRLDVFVTNGLHYYQGPTTLLQNRSRAGNWGGLDLEGPRKNPLGLGAIVKWKTDKRVLKRRLGDEVVFKGQSEVGYVHLGLGDAVTAKVKVKWPGGAVDCLDLPAGTVISVEKGSLGCP